MPYADKNDNQRVTWENRRSSLSTKEAHQARKEEPKNKNKFCEHTEEFLNGPGIADYIVSRYNHRVCVCQNTRFSRNDFFLNLREKWLQSSQLMMMKFGAHLLYSIISSLNQK